MHRQHPSQFLNHNTKGHNMERTSDTIDGLLAEFRGYAAGMPPSYHVTMSWADFRRMLDRIEAAHKREIVLAVSIMRAKLYGISGGLRSITARSDARQRGIHYTEVQNIAAQIENVADNGGES